jgi:putative DNA primase/helicase
MMNARTITKALGGHWHGIYGIARCPAHEDREPSLSIRDGEQELIVNCFAGCNWQDVKTELRRRGLLDATIQHRRSRSRPAAKPSEDDADRRVELAIELWRQSLPLQNTLGWRYFTERRGLHVGLLDDLSHALRWHQRIAAIVALMTDPISNKPTGVHRTYLDPTGCKIDRKMLGKQGVIRLSPDETVTTGLGICEGIEDGLAVLLSEWGPMWAATSAGAIARFPVLSGSESLTIFADTDEVGLEAARACACRWDAAGRDAAIREPQ